MEIDRLNQMFEQAFSGEPMVRGGWMPTVDIFETPDKDVVVKVDLPDMKEETRRSRTTCCRSNERQMSSDIERERFHRIERGYGAFRRSFSLPATVDVSRVDANYQDGVLTVKLPRREERVRSDQDRLGDVRSNAAAIWHTVASSRPTCQLQADRQRLAVHPAR
jgi:HSP20 family protein